MCIRDRHLLSPNLRFSDATSPEQKTKLVQDVRRDQLGKLMELKRDSLGGVSIAEVASGDDAENKLRAQALMLNMQHVTGGRFPCEWLDEKRDAIGLDRLERIELDPNVDRLDVPIAFISRLKYESLDWIKLFTFLQISKDRGDIESGRQISLHVLDRAESPSIVTDADDDSTSEVETAQVRSACVRMAHLYLAALQEDPDKAIDHYRQARAQAVADGFPVGMLLVEELNYRLDHGMVENVESLIETITTRHMNEPGVPESMSALMQQVRLAASMQQQGRADGGVPAPEATPSIIQAGDTGDGGGSESSGLWLPD